MNNISVLFIVVITSCVVERLQAQCMQGQSQCKSIYNCPTMLELAKRMLPDDVQILRRSQCGRIGGVPAVCCPQQPPTIVTPPPTPPPRPHPTQDKLKCTTPDQKPGLCVNLYSCPNLINLLKQSSSNENIQFVQRSRCLNPDPRSVCCAISGTTGATAEPIENQCMTSRTSFPPDPKSGCCGFDTSASNKIFGGEEASIDQYPWLVLIEYSRNGQVKTSCGGSLISGRYVLTAAHCLVGPILDKSGRPVRVRLGEYDKNHEGPDCTQVEAGGEDCTDGVLRIPIEKTIAHPEYNTMSGPRWNDIGLIRLTFLAPFTDFIRPICLPTTDITRFADSSYNFTVAGWGAVSDRQSSSSVKLYVEVPYVSRSECQPVYNNLKKKEPLTSSQLCAGGVKNKDSCKGDSGGPLMYEQNRQFQIIGIVSFGHRICGLENTPAVYTHVYEFDSWIRSNIVA